MIRAAEVAKHRLRLAAHRLGTQDPVQHIGGLLDRTFDMPIGDPRYGNNSLLPGHMPLETSFSETSRDALRIDMEPLGPLVTPHTRVHEVSREARRLVSGQYGQGALRWFDERTEPFRGSMLHGAAKFGAWFGAQFDAGGVGETKVYYELGPGALEDFPPTLRHVCRVAQACLPRLVPIFTSISCNRSQGNQRVYFYHAGDLRLLDLEPLMNQLGVGHQLPSLLTAVGLILGGRFVLPAGSVVIALRDTGKGIEMKLEILLPQIPDPPREMHSLIQLHMSQRPEAQRSLQQWLSAMTPEGNRSAGDMTVLSARVTPTTGARLTLYFRPSGYEQTSSRVREQPMTIPPVRQSDPYAYS